LPGLDISWDVEGSSCLWKVHVISDPIIEADRWLVGFEVTCPWGVLLHCHTLLVSLDLTIDDGLTHAIFLAHLEVKERSVKIVPVEFADLGLDLGLKWDAGFGLGPEFDWSGVAVQLFVLVPP